jgi:hypothetical protein
MGDDTRGGLRSALDDLRAGLRAALGLEEPAPELGLIDELLGTGPRRRHAAPRGGTRMTLRRKRQASRPNPLVLIK